MCTTRLTAYGVPPVALRALPRSPVALRATPRLPVALRATPRLPVALISRARQRRLLTQAGNYLVTEDGRRIVIGVCFG